MNIEDFFSSRERDCGIAAHEHVFATRHRPMTRFRSLIGAGS